MADQRIMTCDNRLHPDALAAHELECLVPFAGISLQELNKREKQLLIFPHCLGANNDGIDKQNLFDIVGGKLQTCNVMGFSASTESLWRFIRDLTVQSTNIFCTTCCKKYSV